MNSVPTPHTPAQPEAIAALDQAVDRLASTEAQALAAYGVLEATVRQLVASIQADDAPARIAGFVSDTLQALALVGQQFEIYRDAADDVVVTAGAALAIQANTDDEQPPAWTLWADMALLAPLPLGRDLPNSLAGLNGLRSASVRNVAKGSALVLEDMQAIKDFALERYGPAGQLVAEDLAPTLCHARELVAHVSLMAVASTCMAAATPCSGLGHGEMNALNQLLRLGKEFNPAGGAACAPAILG